jgi:murein DD-endopeptidase MepM/ murein hydrolase activator NlpD
MNPPFAATPSRFNWSLKLEATQGKLMRIRNDTRLERASGRGTRTGIRMTSMAVALALMVAGAVSTSVAASAEEDYPTFSDVQKANKSVREKTALIERIETILARLERNAQETAQKAEEAGTEAQIAEQKFQEQAVETRELQEQADAAAQDAADAKTLAGQMAMKLYRSGGGDFSTNLWLNASEADNLLYSTGMAGKLSEQATALFDEATQKQNGAQALSDQADVAEQILEELKIEKDKKAEEAIVLAQAAQAAVDEEEAHRAQMIELRAAAKRNAQTTRAEYDKGVEKRQRERERELAARNRIPTASTSQAPQVVGAWARPAWGRVTSNFGYRMNPLGSGTTFHLGTDIGAPCGAPIYAAHAGKVTYSGWNGIYGNYVRLDVGSGVDTEYGHIISGGLKVRVGQKVNAGQLIALVGSTGGSTGCHLHFGVRIDGVVTNPVTFMRQYNVSLG